MKDISRLLLLKSELKDIQNKIQQLLLEEFCDKVGRYRYPDSARRLSILIKRKHKVYTKINQFKLKNWYWK